MRTPTCENPYLVKRQDQLRALASPVRQEIVDALHALGPSTVVSVGRALGRAPDSLYYHLRTLERAELLIRVSEDPVVFDLPGRPLKIDYDTRRPGFRRQLTRALGALLRLTERDVKRAVETHCSGQGQPQPVHGGRTKVWLTEEQHRALLDHFEEVDAQSRRSPQPGSRLYAITRVVCEIHRPPAPWKSPHEPTLAREESS